jgi:hypothetical protein
MPVALNAPPEPFVPEPVRLTPGYALILVGFGAEWEHAAVVRRIRSSLPPRFDLVRPMPYVQLLQMFDQGNPWGTPSYDTAVVVDDLTDEVIAVHRAPPAQDLGPLERVLLPPRRRRASKPNTTPTTSSTRNANIRPTLDG